MNKILFSLTLFTFLFLGLTSGQSLSDNLIAYWDFEELNGPVIDRVNGIHNGTNNGASRGIQGIVGNAFDFDGINQYVRVLDHSDFAFAGNDFTVSGWFNTNNIATQNGPIGKFEGASHWAINFGLPSNKISFFLRQDSTSLGSTSSNSNFNTNIWYYVTLVIDQPNEARLYVNGILEATKDISSISSLSNSGELGIGRPFHTGNPPYFNGKIDEVGIWTRALSQSEIQILYNNGTGLPFSNLGISGVPSPPILDPIGPQQITENQTLTIQLTASDPNNETLTFLTDANSVLPSQYSFNNTSGLFEWTPTYLDQGIYNVTFYVTDGTFVDFETVTIQVIDVSFATISYSGTPIPGNTITFDISDFQNPNSEYVFSGSLGISQGIPLGDGRIIPLNNDWLFNAILFVPQLFGFTNTYGALDSNGNSQVSWVIPTNAGASGQTLHFSFVTLDSPGLPSSNSQITSISPSTTITIL